MANPEHLALFKQGVEAWNKWCAVNPGREGPPLLSSDRRRAHRLWHKQGIPWRSAEILQEDLRRVKLRRVDLSEADLGGADLRRMNLGGADLGGANLRGADLRGADLRWAILIETDFREAILGSGGETRPETATLEWADLVKADFRGADLRWVEFNGADLRETDLRGVDLSVAALRCADLSGANLSEANLSRVSLQDTIFSGVNLAEVKGLDTCYHHGPSHLDVSTLQQSGPLPLAFLQGCGLPDLLIDYLPSLLNQPIQYYSSFISYSSKDEDFAQRLYADLQNKGVRCWFAPEDIQGGRKIYEQLGEAIRLHEKLLLVLSEHSMNSPWVETEIAKARQREKREKRQVLFPIRLVDFETIQQWECFDADTGKDSAREIREYFIPDFSNWKSHDAYRQAFDRLLRDLKPELERKPETS